MRPIRAWHFLARPKLANGDGRRVVAGETLTHDGPLVMCRHGLHASRRPIDALQHAPGPWVQRVEVSGEVIEESDKLVCTARKCLWIANATDTLRHFARLCALDVIDKWDAPDIVVRYLRTGDESIRSAARSAASAAAWAAASAAARDAASAAARDAARSAASAAARDAQNKRLYRMLMDAGREGL